jgi:hypothetical protein
MRGLSALALAGALAFAPRAAPAHQSMSIYEFLPTTIEGTVAEFRFVNPHSILLLKVSGANGATTTWYLEGDAPAMLDRDGFSKDTFHPGDRLRLDIHKLRSGQNGGLWGIRTILQLNGHEFVGHQCVNTPGGGCSVGH